MNGCSGSASDMVEVFALPTVTFTAPADLCFDSGVHAGLGGGSPTGGVYSGDGVTDDGNGMTFSFDPATAGTGTHIITYDYTDPNGCFGSANDDVEVFPLPNVTFTAPADLCINAGVQTALGGGSPTGGVYSGTGVTDDGNGMTFSFDPAAAGAGTHTITYTAGASGCTGSASDDIEVFPLPIVDFTALPDLCVDAGVQAGVIGATPTGGFYSGPGVTDGGDGATYNFDPAAAGVGTHTITYDFTDANGCAVRTTDDVEVFALPNVTFSAPADLCSEAGVQTGLGGGAPTGGVYSGPGVTDDGNGMTYSFNPAAADVGVHTITYTLTDANGCTASASDDVEVFPLPIVGFTAPADLCIDAGVQTGLGGGTPPEGTETGDLGDYSGDGVTDEGNGMTYSLDPAAAGNGVQTITYTYTDENGCTDSASDDIEVFDFPVVTFTAPGDLCIDAGVHTGLGCVLPTGGSYTGDGVTDDGNGMTYSFDPVAAGPGTHTITYTYTDPNGCEGSANDDVAVFGLDYGDLLDPPYNTTNANNAATHCVPTNPLLKLGATVDVEPDGQPSAMADGDDADEDGFVPSSVMFIRGMGQDITLPLMNMTGSTAKLTMFIDWDNDGDFTGTNEMYDAMVNSGETTGTLSGVTPPAGAVINTDLAVRFRISTDMAAVMSPSGGAPDGEVEDYLIQVMVFDYGDLVDAGAGTGEQDYETQSANGGPVHKIVTDNMGNVTLKIGSLIDDELDGQQSDDADGDGDDEDGFDPGAQMFETTVSQDITVPVMNMTGGDAKLTM